MRQWRQLGKRRANATMVSQLAAEPGDFSQRLGISVGGDYYNCFL